jgi:hypothetical protein
MALVFWSELISFLTRQYNKDEEEEDLLTKYKQQHTLMTASFLDQFWNDDYARWTTVSRAQGGGTTSRPSTSWNMAAVYNEEESSPYYRAVDQAFGVLACMGILKVMELDSNPTSIQSSKVRVTGIVRDTCYELLSPDGFGYGLPSPPDASAYIGLGYKRNFWHDAWVMLALIMARKYAWPNDANHGEEPLRLLLHELVDRYGNLMDDSANGNFDGTVWHWEKSLKNGYTNGNSRYCNENALLYAMTRTLDWCPGGLSEYQAGFWNFFSELQEGNDGGLVSVGDIYRQVRLHPNTELAALLLWPPRS